MPRFLLVGLLVAGFALGTGGAGPDARAAGGQVCRFNFLHDVARAHGRHGWNVAFGAAIGCAEPTSRLELGGNLVSWGTAKDCHGCGAGWLVTSAFTRPQYKVTHGAGSLLLVGHYFERRRRRHKIWVTFAVQPVGSRLDGFHDTNTKKCLIQQGDFYGCDGFSGAFR